LWAGVSDEFFHKRRISGTERSIYTETTARPSDEQRDACERKHPDQSLADASGVNLQFFSIEPAGAVAYRLETWRPVLFDEAVTAARRTEIGFRQKFPPTPR